MAHENQHDPRTYRIIAPPAESPRSVVKRRCTPAYHAFCKLGLEHFLASTTRAGVQAGAPELGVGPLLLGNCEHCRTTLALPITAGEAAELAGAS